MGDRSGHKAVITLDTGHKGQAVVPTPSTASRQPSGGRVLAFPGQAERDTAALARALTRLLYEAECAEQEGPHVVIAHGPKIQRVFGPFSSRPAALAAATEENRSWDVEFPGVPIRFDVAPLLDTQQLGLPEPDADAADDPLQ